MFDQDRVGQRVSDLTVHRNKPVLVSLPLNNYQFGGISALPPRIGKKTGLELKLRCPTFNFSNSITFRIPVPNETEIGASRKATSSFQHREEPGLFFVG